VHTAVELFLMVMGMLVRMESRVRVVPVEIIAHLAQDLPERAFVRAVAVVAIMDLMDQILLPEQTLFHRHMDQVVAVALVITMRHQMAEQVARLNSGSTTLKDAHNHA
jgi:hypothetical protein